MQNKRLHKKASRNRGVAIEMALSMLVLVFALCTLLVTFTLSSRSESKQLGKALEQKAMLDQVGEDFLYHVKKNTVGTDFKSDRLSGDDYKIETGAGENSDGQYHLKISSKSDNTVKLEVIISKNDATVSIVKWTRS